MLRVFSNIFRRSLFFAVIWRVLSKSSNSKVTFKVMWRDIIINMKAYLAVMCRMQSNVGR